MSIRNLKVWKQDRHFTVNLGKTTKNNDVVLVRHLNIDGIYELHSRVTRYFTVL